MEKAYIPCKHLENIGKLKDKNHNLYLSTCLSNLFLTIQTEFCCTYIFNLIFLLICHKFTFISSNIFCNIFHFLHYWGLNPGPHTYSITELHPQSSSPPHPISHCYVAQACLKLETSHLTPQVGGTSGPSMPSDRILNVYSIRSKASFSSISNWTFRLELL
jgi:hypothetical protein